MHVWTETQRRRLVELEAGLEQLDRRFSNPVERDKDFQVMEKELTRRGLAHLEDLRLHRRQPALCQLEYELVSALIRAGFCQVTTPIIMSKAFLKRMGIGPDHPLTAQVYWLDNNQCLRPMLAPHLYAVLKDLLRLWPAPVSIFEVGSCFRKESKGAEHSSEFTMLNLVQMGLAEADRQARLEEYIAVVMKAAGIDNYRLVMEISEVYGETIDVVAGENDLEVGSAAMGPLPMDDAWRVTVPWVGVGFGLERLLMAGSGSSNLRRHARSLSYLDGIRLNI
ncbi:MAG: pyrrolysine--tRNA(Pyl) ligase large subunit [Deltaproteobacteria bacterium]|nr:pyrrolysine--tRNA(Pyl) ligase large subunit [Deltaproteobacteria bacterium]